MGVFDDDEVARSDERRVPRRFRRSTRRVCRDRRRTNQREVGTRTGGCRQSHLARSEGSPFGGAGGCVVDHVGSSATRRTVASHVRRSSLVRHRVRRDRRGGVGRSSRGSARTPRIRDAHSRALPHAGCEDIRSRSDESGCGAASSVGMMAMVEPSRRPPFRARSTEVAPG